MINDQQDSEQDCGSNRREDRTHSGENLLTAAELSKWLHVGRNTVYVWVSRREIPFVKLPGNTTRFPQAAICEWLKKRTASGKGVSRGTYLDS